MRLKSLLPNHKVLLPTGGLLVADIAVFGGTNPQTVPSFMLIVSFVLLCLTIYCVLKGVLGLVALAGLPIAQSRRVLRIGTVLFGLCVALQSVGQLSSRDVLVLSLLTCLFYAYIAYTKGLKA